MARTLTTAQTNTFNREVADFVDWWTVEIEDADGTYRDYGDYLDRDWRDGFRWSVSVDEPVPKFTVRLARDHFPGYSTAPLIEDSPVNRDSAGDYATAADIGRGIRIKVAVVEAGRHPAASEFITLADGEIDRLDWGSDVMEAKCRDTRMATLADRWVETVTGYGSDAGVAIETVIQSILTDHAGGLTLYSENGTAGTPFAGGDSPGFLISPAYNQQQQSVLQATDTLTQMIGRVVRVRYLDSISDFALVMYEPDRTKTTADWTFGPDDYTRIEGLNLDRRDVRNAITVKYVDSNGELQTVTSEDATSIAAYGRRWMQFIEGGDSPINTDPEAQAMADAARQDLSLPVADQDGVSLPGCWWFLEIGDLLAFEPNRTHYDIEQKLAIYGITIEGTANGVRTSVQTRGKPAGMYSQWRTNRRGRRTGIDSAHVSIEVAFGAAGAISANVSTGRIAANIFVTAGDGSEPSDPTSSDTEVEGFSGTAVPGVSVSPGDVAHVKAVAQDASGNLGPVAYVQVRRPGNPVSIELESPPVYAINGSDQAQADVILAVRDPEGADTGGSVELWTDPSATTSPNPQTDAADATIPSVDSGETIGYTGSGADHTDAALTDVVISDKKHGGKFIYARYTTSDGRKSRIQEIALFRRPSDVDDVDDGSTYARTKGTELSSGQVKRLRAATGAFNVEADDIFAGTNRLKNSVKVKDTSSGFVPNRHNESDQGDDGDSVTFAQNYEGIPQFTIIPQKAKTFAAGLGTASDQLVNLKAVSPSSSSFTLRAQIEQASTISSISDGFSSSQNASAPENGTVALTADGAVAYSNLEDANGNETTYTARYDVDTTGMDALNLLTVELYYNDGAASSSWTLGASATYDAGNTWTAETLAFAAALGADYDLRLRISYSSAPGANTATVTARGEDSSPTGVSFDKVTSAGSFEPMTDGGADHKVKWHSMEAP